MAERVTSVTKRIAAAGLFAGMAGWAASGQTPPVFEPPTVLPGPTYLPQSPRPETLPLPAKAVSPSRPDFNLRTPPERNSLTFDAGSRETLPAPVPAFAEIPPNTPLTFPPMPPREDSAVTIKNALLSAAIGATLAGAPAYAQDSKVDDKTKIPAATDAGKSADPPKDADTTKSADLKKELESVKAMLETLTAKQKQLGDAVLGKDEGKGPDAGLTKKIDDLTASMKVLDESVKKLDDKMTKLGDTVTRTSNASPLTKKEAIPAASGVVKLINGYGERVTMILNGTPHRLEPGETKDVNVPPGVFDYALPLAGGEVKTSKVKDNEIVTLRIK